MKKVTILVLFLLSGSVYCQKKKAVSKVIAPVVIAKSGNASAEMMKDDFYLFVSDGVKKDTLKLKKYTTPTTPAECKITSYTTKGTPMYYVSWVEKTINETKLKKEEATITESQIWNPATKSLVTANTQSVTKIKEIVFLDRLKNASETQERTRSGGYLFTFLDGNFSLKDKSSESKYTYNATSMKYEIINANASVTNNKTGKKKRR